MQEYSTSRGLNALDSHQRRIEELEGMCFPLAVGLRYFAEKNGTPALTKMWGITFRAFRALCQRHGIDMKSMSDAVTDQWENADDRREFTSDLMKDTMSRYDFSGENNPAKRPDVRAKISAFKKIDNAMSRPEVAAKAAASKRAFYAKYPEKHPNHKMARSDFRSSIEVKMENALTAIGIDTVAGYRITSLWPDLAIPSAKLVIECDGVYWHTAEADAIRDAKLNAKGWTVLHFTDIEINNDVADCAEQIRLWLASHWANNA